MSVGLELEEPLGLEKGAGSFSSLNAGNSDQSEEAIPSSHGTWSVSRLRKCRLAVVAAFFCLGVIIAIVYKALRHRGGAERGPLCVHVQAVTHLTGPDSGAFAGMLAEVVSVDSREDKLATIKQNRKEYLKLIVESVGAWPEFSGKTPDLRYGGNALFQVHVASHDLEDEELIAGVTCAAKQDPGTEKKKRIQTQLALGDGGGVFATPKDEIAKVDEVRKLIAPVSLGFLDARPASLAVRGLRPGSGAGSGGGSGSGSGVGAPFPLHHLSGSVSNDTKRGLCFSVLEHFAWKDGRFSSLSLGRSAMEVLTCDRAPFPASFRLHGRPGQPGQPGKTGKRFSAPGPEAGGFGSSAELNALLSPAEHRALVEDLIFNRLGPAQGPQLRPLLLRMDQYRRGITREELAAFEVDVETEKKTFDAVHAYTEVYRIIKLARQSRRAPTVLDFPMKVEGRESRIGHRFFLGALLVAERLDQETRKRSTDWDRKYTERLRVLRDYVIATDGSAGGTGVPLPPDGLFLGGKTMQEALKLSGLLVRILTGLEEDGAGICFESCKQAFGPIAEKLRN